MSGNSPIKLLNGILILLGMMLSLVVGGFAQTNVTPAQWLALQPKPQFRAGHQLPHLTRWGWQLSSNACVEVARNWGYALDLNWAKAAARNLTNANSMESGFIALANSNPTTYAISVLVERSFTNPPASFYCTNAAGLFVDRTGTNFFSGSEFTRVVSPEGPDSYWQGITEYWMNDLRSINSNVPISIVLNGGEYGLDVAGFGWQAWNQDARVRAIFGTNWDAGNSKFSSNQVQWYSSVRKSHQLSFLTTAIEELLPNREMYLFYNTGREQNRYTYFADWSNGVGWWGWNAESLITNTDVPNFESYYDGFRGWLKATNTLPNDILDRHLNAVGYYMKLGIPTNYSWVCGGWDQGRGASDWAEINRYKGFLKCLYTGGMVGAVAGYFDYPVGGFDAAFPSNSPPHWLQQMVALGQVHALFSHLDNFLLSGDLLPGSGNHIMSRDQPSYEFTNTVADATCRVLARKLRTRDQWLITAWAATGPDRPVTVSIPALGAIQVVARDLGSVYLATPSTLTQQDPNGDWRSSIPPPGNLRTLPPTGP